MIGSLALIGGLPAAARALEAPAGSAAGVGANALGEVREKPHGVGALVDRDRAAEIMAREGLSGLVVSDPINLYYLTGLDVTHFMRSLTLGVTTYGVVPRDPGQPVGLVMNSF